MINILSKNARDTQGGLVSGGGGMQVRGFAGARYGGRIGEDAYYRIYGTYLDHDQNVLPDGSGAHNPWHLGRAGFRADWNATARDLITFQSDWYAGRIRQVFSLFNPSNAPSYTDSVNDDMRVSGGHVLGRWTRMFSDTASLKVQAFFDHTERDRKSTRLNSSHIQKSRMPSSA